jgi:predicted flap endonuclease-1-like 5' DNA nuclease
MTELLWQTMLLLAGAFFVGAVVACSLKRRFYYGPSVGKAAAVAAGSAVSAAAPAPDAAQPKIEAAPRTADEGQRFERALSGQAGSAAAEAAPLQLIVPPTAVKVEPVKATTETPAPAPAAPAAPAAEAPQGIPRVSVATGSGAPMPVEEGGAGPSEDLTRIDGVDSSIQGRLKEQGVRRMQDLADLSPADVKGLSEALHLGGRIEREDWVGQAQILAAGGETYYSRRVDHGMPVPEGEDPAAAIPKDEPAPPAAEPVVAISPPPAAEPAPVAAPSPEPVAETPVAPAPPAPAVEPPVAAAAAAAPAPEPAPASGPDNGFPVSDVSHLRSVRSEALVGEEGGRASLRPAGDLDDLKRIRGIGVLIEKKLNSLGVTHYEQVANWTGADIERISRILDFKGRIERENWIEQARILATGGQTEFSRRGGG